MPTISRLLDSRKVSNKFANTQVCSWHACRKSLAIGFIESLERRVLLSGGGNLDPTFGPGGFVKGYEVLSAQADGSLIAQQVDNKGNTGGLFVLNSNGSLQGPYNGAPPGSPSASPLSYSDGRYIRFANSHQSVTRYNADGTVDTSFGNNGTVSDFSTGTGYAPGSFTPQGFEVINDQLYVAGTYNNTQDELTEALSLERLNNNGTIDTTFGAHGIAIGEADEPGLEPQEFSVTVGPNGHFYLVGDDGNDDPLIEDFDANGSFVSWAMPYANNDYNGFGGGIVFNNNRLYFFTSSLSVSPLTAYTLDLGSVNDFGLPGQGYTFVEPNLPGNVSDSHTPSSIVFGPDGRMFISDFFDYGYPDGQDTGEYTLAYLPGSDTTGSISGTVYYDTNGNGIKDAGETGQISVEAQEFVPSFIRMYADLNGNGQYDLNEPYSPVAPNGYYQIKGLQPGTYTILETPVDGLAVSTPSSRTVTVAANQDSGGNDFGNRFAERITGTVFNDINGDGIQEAGEAGLAGQKVYIDVYNYNGILDPGEDQVTTDANGNYAFLGLKAGTYRIREVVPAGSSATKPGVSPGSDVYYTVTLPSGATAVNNIDFGQYSSSTQPSPPTPTPTPTPVPVSSTPAQIVGTVFNDSNGNGVRRKREKPLSGVEVYADLNNDGQLESGEPTATTDAQGQYTLVVPQGGTYQVRAVPPVGWIQTSSNSADLPAQVSSGASVHVPNIGLTQGASLSGLVVNDVKGKGHVNKKSPGLAGWRVFVDLNGDGIWQPNEPSALTDATGSYTITGLSAGKVELRVVPQSGWKQTTPKNDAPLLLRLALKKQAKAKPIGLQQLA